MPTLSYCKSVNNCSPNLLLFKVDRYEKFYFDPFFPCRAFWPCPAQSVIHIAQCPCPLPIMPCPAFCPRSALLLLCPLLICPSALPFPALSYPALSSPALPANSPISGRGDRKVLRLMYICMYIVAYIAARICRGWHESQKCVIFELR